MGGLVSTMRISGGRGGLRGGSEGGSLNGSSDSTERRTLENVDALERRKDLSDSAAVGGAWIGRDENSLTKGDGVSKGGRTVSCRGVNNDNEEGWRSPANAAARADLDRVKKFVGLSM